jgi:hypothetical protein
LLPLFWQEATGVARSIERSPSSLFLVLAVLLTTTTAVCCQMCLVLVHLELNVMYFDMGFHINGHTIVRQLLFYFDLVWYCMKW